MPRPRPAGAQEATGDGASPAKVCGPRVLGGAPWPGVPSRRSASRRPRGSPGGRGRGPAPTAGAVPRGRWGYGCWAAHAAVCAAWVGCCWAAGATPPGAEPAPGMLPGLGAQGGSCEGPWRPAHVRRCCMRSGMRTCSVAGTTWLCSGLTGAAWRLLCFFAGARDVREVGAELRAAAAAAAEAAEAAAPAASQQPGGPPQAVSGSAAQRSERDCAPAGSPQHSAGQQGSMQGGASRHDAQGPARRGQPCAQRAQQQRSGRHSGGRPL